MKKIKTRSRDLLREAFVFGGALLFMQGINAFAIIRYNTEWKELYTQIGYVLFLGIVLYLLIVAVRLLVKMAARLFTRIRTS